jgi:hypothetical protein
MWLCTRKAKAVSDRSFAIQGAIHGAVWRMPLAAAFASVLACGPGSAPSSGLPSPTGARDNPGSTRDNPGSGIDNPGPARDDPGSTRDNPGPPGDLTPGSGGGGCPPCGGPLACTAASLSLTFSQSQSASDGSCTIAFGDAGSALSLTCQGTVDAAGVPVGTWVAGGQGGISLTLTTDDGGTVTFACSGSGASRDGG